MADEGCEVLARLLPGLGRHELELVERYSAPTDADGKTLRLELGQAELAESTGLTRETVNRSLARLERAGIVETERGAVLVYDIEGLRTYEE